MRVTHRGVGVVGEVGRSLGRVARKRESCRLGPEVLDVGARGAPEKAGESLRPGADQGQAID